MSEVDSVGATPAAPMERSELLVRFPPRPVADTWPATQAPRSAMVNRLLSPPFALPHQLSQRTRRVGVLAVVSWLQAREGETWQARWRASAAESQADWRTLIDAPDGTAQPGTRRRTGPLLHLAPGLLVFICADVIRPSLPFLLASAPTRRQLALEMARTRDPSGFERLGRCLAKGTVGLQPAQQALTRVACIMAAKGGLVGDVTVGDCIELLELTRQMGGDAEGHGRSSLFYQVLRANGSLGEDAPAALRVFAGRGQPSPPQLIDRYQIACRPVRDLLVDYLAERQPSVDFSSLQRFAYLLGKLFWADLEAHHPGIDSLKLPREVAAAWKERVMTKTRGGSPSARLDGRSVLSAVRAFYLDLVSGRRRTRCAGDPTPCAPRSQRATSATRRTACGASPAWTSARGSAYPCSPPSSPTSTPSAAGRPNCSPPQKRLQKARCSAPGASRSGDR